MKKAILILAGFVLPGFSLFAQREDRNLKECLSAYFNSYETQFTTPRDRCRVDRVTVDSNTKQINVFANELFASQPFTPENVDVIYKTVKGRLPASYKSYNVTVYGKDYPIEDLIPNDIRKSADPQRKWNTLYRGAPWVEEVSRPYRATEGLEGRHMTVYASHGRYYKNDMGRWKWQRPCLLCSCEDLLTQTFVVPFLIPMLENAGACVFTPRERDWQKAETIVDNDQPAQGGTYTEKDNKFNWVTAETGFARRKAYYIEGENPFTDGTARFTQATNKKGSASEIRWTPQLPEDGRYAVYVSYQSSANNVPDARYEVRHKGITSIFHVNQRMGGSTWVYLGTFEFDKDNPQRNYVCLSNLSGYRGIVSADAVRFGGGMGLIARGDSLQPVTSGVPRYLEGARYNAQWSGMPRSVYSSKNGLNDYSDDINVRSYMTNYLAGGSCYLPSDSGLHVPIELSVAIHSDAGLRNDNSYIGTLGIYTTDFNDGKLPAGMHRLSSRDLCDRIMTQVDHDLTALYGRWQRRAMFDRNYSETREPQIPSMILEMFSHQNFSDMVKAHDPMFKFNMARAVYKGILKYSAFQHGKSYTVAPLPVKDFFIRLNESEHEMELSWAPQNDPLEASARPSGYIVYTKKGDSGFDNGTYVKSPNLTIGVERDCMYAFKVAAVNEGGKSFPSETLTAMIAGHPTARILIVDGFQRVAGPQVVETDSTRGFDMNYDPGVPYGKFPGYCGNQLVYGRNGSAAGMSGNELETQLIAGNSFDGCMTHGEAIMHSGKYSFTSASRGAVENHKIDLKDYHVVDLFLGLQKNDGYSTVAYPTLTPQMVNALQEYTRMRGNLLVSGAYLGRDQRTRESLDFIGNTLKVDAYAPHKMDSAAVISGMNLRFGVYSRLNETHYAVTNADCLMPKNDAYSTLLYAPYNYSAAVAYPGTTYRSIAMGFPFECITEADVRNRIMEAFLNFLLGR